MSFILCKKATVRSNWRPKICTSRSENARYEFCLPSHATNQSPRSSTRSGEPNPANVALAAPVPLNKTPCACAEFACYSRGLHAIPHQAKGSQPAVVKGIVAQLDTFMAMHPEHEFEITLQETRGGWERRAATHLRKSYMLMPSRSKTRQK